MTTPAGVGDADLDHPSVVTARVTLGETFAYQTLHRSGGGGGIDSQGVGEVAHPPAVLLDQEIEGVHLAGLERIVAGAEQIVAQRTGRGPSTHLAPGETDAQARRS
jgi:hypothetical protein